MIAHQVVPYFLANFVDATLYPRRVYIDLGIKDFESSLCWIMQHYPIKFDQIYGFECAKDFSNVTALMPNVARCIEGTPAQSIGYRDTTETINSMFLHYKYVGVEDDASTSPPTTGLGRFLKTMAIEKEDFVVVKMDVEGIEYELIESILNDGTYTLIDEVSARGANISYHAFHSHSHTQTTLAAFCGDPLQPSRYEEMGMGWVYSLSQ